MADMISTSIERLLRMFYIVLPSRTTFEHLEEVPNYITQAIPLFFMSLILEFLFYGLGKREALRKQNGKWNLGKFRLNDAVSSISAGIIQQLSQFFISTFELSAYIYIWDNFRVYELDSTSVITWIAAFLVADFGYYWFHRAAHEVNLFWAAHVVHHSSEYYNQSTALRQSVFQTYFSFIFYLPAALCLPPSMFAVHKQLNTLYQYWIHTETIPRLGLLEYIINTPSAHRVHHGRNPYCIDKNYAGTLIIWDRIFGTYEDELTPPFVTNSAKIQPVAYGLTHPIMTFDPLTTQTHHFRHIFTTAARTPGFLNKLKVLFYGPGWHPGTPRTGLLSEIPPIDPVHPPVKYDPKIPLLMNTYTAIHFLVTVGLVDHLLVHHNTYSLPACQLGAAFVFFGLWSFGKIFDARPEATLIELIRTIIAFAATEYLRRFAQIKNWELSAVLGLRVFYVVSVFIMAWILIQKGSRWMVETEKTDNKKIQ